MSEGAKDEEMHTLSIDDVYGLIGHFGKGQKIYYMAIVSIHFFTAHHMLLNIFAGLEPTFECYARNGTSGLSPLINTCFDNDHRTCRLHYTSDFTSFAIEWNLICHEKYRVALVQSIWMAGVMTGALLLGGLADKLGRMKTLMVMLMGTVTFEGFSAFAPTFELFLSMRFLGGMCCALVILVSFVLSQELIGSSWRSVCGLYVSGFFAVGIAFMSLLAYLIPNWRILTLVCAVMGGPFLFLPCFVPESPRWLVIVGRHEDAKTVLENIAKRNGTQKCLPSRWELSRQGPPPVRMSKNSEGIMGLAAHPYIMTVTAIQIFSWMVNSITYYGLTMASKDIGSNVYTATALSGIIEIPAYVLGAFLIEKWGRRIVICAFMIVGGIACLSIQAVPQSAPTVVVTVLALVGKLSIALTFAVIYVHSGEIFPTIIRNAGMGIVSVAARIGGILAPFIIMMGEVWPNLHFTFIGLLVFLSGILNLKLPETLGKPLPETIADILTLRTPEDDVKKGRVYTRLKQDDDAEEGLMFRIKEI
ncbi:solute carrier family 22 member 15-like [Oratosquilla oratoria]|uniref:solute carrier family 22 member 15-like n=1 Tax=Oratosquilla oratoria TaxID=337810 RepID=UPI003F76AF20